MLNQLYRSSKKNFYVHPKREIAEYFACLYAILDDTDLLSKASSRDITCIAALLNRLKQLTSSAEEGDLIQFDDLSRDNNFSSAGATRILQNKDMYSIYSKIVAKKEVELKHALTRLKEGDIDLLFSDTKEQNGCCRIGQTKLVSSSFPLFIDYAPFNSRMAEAS